MEYLIFWDVTQHRLVTSYRRFGTVFRSHLPGSSCLTLQYIPPSSTQNYYTLSLWLPYCSHEFLCLSLSPVAPGSTQDQSPDVSNPIRFSPAPNTDFFFFADHFQIVHPSLSWLSNGAFSLCDILTHFLHSFFFWHSFHMPSSLLSSFSYSWGIWFSVQLSQLWIFEDHPGPFSFTRPNIVSHISRVFSSLLRSVKTYEPNITAGLTFWRRNYFCNFSTFCIQNVNNTNNRIR